MSGRVKSSLNNIFNSNTKKSIITSTLHAINKFFGPAWLDKGANWVDKSGCKPPQISYTYNLEFSSSSCLTRYSQGVRSPSESWENIYEVEYATLD